jgi:hypothetical protein
MDPAVLAGTCREGGVIDVGGGAAERPADGELADGPGDIAPEDPVADKLVLICALSSCVAPESELQEAAVALIRSRAAPAPSRRIPGVIGSA